MKLIIDLSIDPSKLTETNFSNMSEDTLLKLLIENQIMLPFLKNLSKFPNSQLSSFENRIIEIMKKNYMSDFEVKMTQTLSLLENLNIECMMHKYSFFEREQSDIDILVPIEKFDQILNRLKKEDFIPSSQELYKVAMTKFDNNSKFTIHVHSKIKWESEFISTDDVWKRSRHIKINNSLILIPSVEDSILIECAHTFFENRLIRLCDLLQFLELFKHDTVDWNKVIERLVQYKYEAAGYLYFLAMNHLTKKLYNLNSIPQEILDKLENNISRVEKLLMSHAKKKILSDNSKSLPLRLSPLLSALLFVSFNKKIGTSKFMWSISVIFLATIRYLQVKLGLRKL